MKRKPPTRKTLKINIASTSRLASILGISEAALIAIADEAGRYFNPFVKKNKSPRFAKKDRAIRFRPIDNPVGALKSIQELIHERLLKSLPWPDHIMGGVPGKSLVSFVKEHSGSPVIVALDIRKFFPSIRNRHIFQVWSRLLGCSPEVARLLTRLTTFEGHLPQGAPTSTALANLVLFSCDGPIREFCTENGITYGTWIDDLAFSGMNARLAINVAVKVLAKNGFALPHKKQRIMSASVRQTLTGVVVNNEAGLPKAYHSNTRSAIHKLRTGQVRLSELPNYLSEVRGRIAYIRTISPSKGLRLRTELTTALCDQLV